MIDVNEMWYNHFAAAAAAAKSLQSCPTPCDPMDSSPPGSSVHRTLQAKTLEWVAISCSIVMMSHCQLKTIYIEYYIMRFCVNLCKSYIELWDSI